MFQFNIIYFQFIMSTTKKNIAVKPHAKPDKKPKLKTIIIPPNILQVHQSFRNQDFDLPHPIPAPNQSQVPTIF